MDHYGELEYIRMVREGNLSAYAALVDRYKTLAYAIALKIVRNEEDAEDVAQEGFIKAFQQLHQFEGKSKFSTWLYTIVYRTALQKAKETKLKTFSITQQFREDFTDDYSHPQASMMEADDAQRSINNAIQKLPKTEALLVMLYYIHDHSVREIQDITGLSLPNVKIKLFRARKSLERELRFLIDDGKAAIKQNEKEK
jgi:RNA polymerase sigma-70 factor (ECF subfamily)